MPVPLSAQLPDTYRPPVLEARSVDPDLGHRELLYLLRCVEVVVAGFADEIGIGPRHLHRALSLGYLSQDRQGRFSLSVDGLRYLMRSGGPFAHRAALRLYA